MKVVSTSKGDRKRWDEVVSSSPDSTYAHTWQWLDLYRAHTISRVLALAAETGDEFTGIYGGFVEEDTGPGLSRFAKGAVFWSPHELTWDYGGPCLAGGADISVAGVLTAAMERHARKQGVRRIRVSPFSSRIAAVLRSHGYEPRERLTSLIPLDVSEERLWKTTAKAFRYSVRKAERERLEFEVGTGKHSAVVTDCLASIAKLKGLVLPPSAFMRDALELDSALIRAWWTLVRDSRGTPLSAGVMFAHKGILTLRWGGATEDGKRLMADHLRMWRVLLWAREEGLEWVDQGGLPSDRRSGIHRFKVALGGETRHVDWFVKYLRLARAGRTVKDLVQRRTAPRRFASRSPETGDSL